MSAKWNRKANVCLAERLVRTPPPRSDLPLSPSVSLSLSDSPLSPPSDALWHCCYFHNFDHRSQSQSVTFIFPPYRAVFFYNALRRSLSTLPMSYSLSWFYFCPSLLLPYISCQGFQCMLWHICLKVMITFSSIWIQFHFLLAVFQYFLSNLSFPLHL